MVSIQLVMIRNLSFLKIPSCKDTSTCLQNDFFVRPLVACVPAWIRFAQCLRRYRDSKEAFPHLVNAGKYASTFLVVIFGTLRSYYQMKWQYENTFDNPFVWAWLASSVFASCYAYTWDIKMDWGLFDKNAGENTFLREEIVYSSTVSFVVIIWKPTQKRYFTF